MNKALNSLHSKILKSKFAEEVTEAEIEALVEAKVRSCGDCSRRKWYQIGYKDGKSSNYWISCSEKLPELHEEVLVTQFFDDSEHYNVTNASLISTLDGSGRVRWCSYDHFIDYVIAWQPLPQPYKEA